MEEKNSITYKQLKDEQKKETDSFIKKYMFFAFSDEQFIEGMKKIGLEEKETNRIISVGAGAYLLKEKKELWENLNKKHELEINEQIQADIEGTGFIKSMFLYEMANHEYGYTRDLTETLEALPISKEDLENNANIKKGLNLAKKEYLLLEEKQELEEKINNVLEKAMSETSNGSAIISTDEIDLNNEEIKMIIQNDPRISDVEFYKENGKSVADIVFYLENCPNLDLGQDEIEQQQENRLDKIKNFLEQVKDLDYKDYFCAVILNEVIDNKQDIMDITNKDLKVCDKYFDEYMQNNSMQLLGNEIVDMINGTYSFQNEVEEDM